MMPTVGEEEEAGRPTAMRDNDDNKERGARAQAQAQGSGGGGCGVEEEEEVVVVVRETVDDVVTANANVNKLHHLLCLSASLIDKLHGEVRECSAQFSRELNELQQIADEQELLDAKLDSTLTFVELNPPAPKILSPQFFLPHTGGEGDDSPSHESRQGVSEIRADLEGLYTSMQNQIEDLDQLSNGLVQSIPSEYSARITTFSMLDDLSKQLDSINAFLFTNTGDL